MQCWRFRTTRYDIISTDWIQTRVHAIAFHVLSSLQEMLLDGGRDESITVEILEHVGDVRDNGSARWFLEDLAADQGTVLTEVSHCSSLKCITMTRLLLHMNLNRLDLT